MIPTQAKTSMSTPTSDLFKPVLGVDCLNKPRGKGMWTSTWLGQHEISDWVRWSVEDGMADPDTSFQVWLLEVDPWARVLEIDSEWDLDAVCEKYQGPRPAAFDFGKPGMFPYVDFDQIVADGYQGVHLTQEGQWATRFRHNMDAASLYGWDCESTVWLRWVFTSVEYAGELRRNVIEAMEDQS